MGVRNIDLWKTMVERPEVGDWLSAVHQDDKRAFTAEEVDQKLEEGVESEGLPRDQQDPTQLPS